MTTDDADAIVRYQVADHIATITMNRPEAMNAVNADLANGIGDALEAAAHDRDVRVVVLTGVGRAFCAGADLKAVAAGENVFPDRAEWGFGGLMTHWIDKPIIAAVNGFAVGGGTEMLLAVDLAVASDEAKFGLPEVKRGLIAAGGGVVRLQRQVALKQALEIALVGDTFDAHTARDVGLINRVAPADQLMNAAYELAGKIAANAPLSVQHTKRAIYEASAAGSDWSMAWTDNPWSVSKKARDIVFASSDAKEGPRAFAEKRAPRWEGR
ncbi:enoyl-CoA hydratase [Gordonia sp. TBRC 11910]|uniref:Enoyl-CoA hydratase n=1 Tax=Gordonia asplenii TaxID=2725283 RepID=A0A848KLT8_9ACTN|nr:enoyl-CoA hydratase-related protein [Gordonia asplenii]NMO00054.1 enoyl-CoA hydratase [Gordonia asplenii]